MTKEQAKAEIMQIYGYLSPDKQQALDVLIQEVKDIDKMNNIDLDLASENDDLIEKMDAIRAEIADRYENDGLYFNSLKYALEIIDKYRGESEG